MSRAGRVGALAPLLLLAGCQTPTPGPGRTLSVDDPRLVSRIQALEQRAAARNAMRGTAIFSVNAKDLRVRGTQRLAARRPARLRVEVLGLFSQVAAVLVTDGHSYALYDAREGDIERGRVTPGLLWDVARVDLEPGQVVSLLLGALTPLPGLAIGSARLQPDGSLLVKLEGARPGAFQRLEFDGGGRLIRFETRGLPHVRDFDAVYADYRDVGGVPFAFDVELHFPHLAARAKIRFRQVELDPDLPDDLFVLQIPERVSSRPEGGGR